METDKQISSSWNFGYGTKKRHFIKNTIVDIYNLIPKEKKNARSRLSSILESLWYKAPECINQTWDELFNFLQTNLTLYKDKSKNPTWICEIQRIWLENNKIILDSKEGTSLAPP